jgi:hypothetical protein
MSIRQDVRFAVRSLARGRGTTLVAMTPDRHRDRGQPDRVQPGAGGRVPDTDLPGIPPGGLPGVQERLTGGDRDAGVGARRDRRRDREPPAAPREPGRRSDIDPASTPTPTSGRFFRYRRWPASVETIVSSRSSRV